jgi:hypothetical protein
MGRAMVYPEPITWHVPHRAESGAVVIPVGPERQPVAEPKPPAAAMELPLSSPTLPQRMLRGTTEASAMKPIEGPRTNASALPAVLPAAPPRVRLPGQIEFEPFDVVLGEPRLIFSITNSPGEVYHGFLELVGPE